MHDGEREPQALALALGQAIGAAGGQLGEAEADQRLVHRLTAARPRDERDPRAVFEVAAHVEAVV